MGDQLPAAGCGVQLLLQASKVHTPLLQVPHQLNEMAEGTSRPVQPPHNKGVLRADKAECLG
jgi:hypothetical protein